MTQHGSNRPQAQAIALRSTAQAVLDAGHADLAANPRAISDLGSNRITIETRKPARARVCYDAAVSMLSGDFISKSP